MAFYTLLTTLPIYVIQEFRGNEPQVGSLVTTMRVAAIPVIVQDPELDIDEIETSKQKLTLNDLFEKKAYRLH